MAIRFNAEDEPAKTRVDYWQHVVGSSLAPYQVRADGGSLRSQIHQAQIGAVSVLDLQISAAQGIRAPDLIRRSDLGMCKIDLGIRGRAKYEQDDRQSLLAPGEFHLIDLSRPSRVAIEAAHEVSVVMFPRELLPAYGGDLRDLTAVPFSAQDPHAALVASLGRELIRHLDYYEGDRGARVGAVFLDLLALAVATRVDRVSCLPPETRQQAMLARVRAFIEEHLGDPGLSPALIAAAHHVSVRTLHKLYEADGDTVAASVRRRRLERCRQDLLDAGLHARPAGAIGARWGFRDAAGFSRAFRAAYGLPPAEYRAIHAGGDLTRGKSARDEKRTDTAATLHAALRAAGI
jgi:AraC-like DNA-binding protein